MEICEKATYSLPDVVIGSQCCWVPNGFKKTQSNLSLITSLQGFALILSFVPTVQTVSLYGEKCFSKSILILWVSMGLCLLGLGDNALVYLCLFSCFSFFLVFFSFANCGVLSRITGGEELFYGKKNSSDCLLLSAKELVGNDRCFCLGEQFVRGHRVIHSLILATKMFTLS